jgi:hypothetical protein
VPGELPAPHVRLEEGVAAGDETRFGEWDRLHRERQQQVREQLTADLLPRQDNEFVLAAVQHRGHLADQRHPTGASGCVQQARQPALVAAEPAQPRRLGADDQFGEGAGDVRCAPG